MRLEQRGWVKRLHLEFNCVSRRKLLSATKPFIIPKQLVMEAFKAVKANAGAAGVDRQSIADFEKDLKGQSVQGLEPDVVGKLLSSSGQSGGNTQEERRHKDSGSSDRSGQSGTDGGQDDL